MQLTLFDNPARQRVRGTQVEAWIRIQDSLPASRGRVYGAIVTAGDRGVTRQELVDLVGMPINAVCGRVNELLGGKPVDGVRPYPVLVYEKENRDGRGVLRVR